MAGAAKNNQGKQTSELRDVLLGCRGPISAAAIFSLTITLLMLVPPIFMLQMYDRVLPSRSAETLVNLTIIAILLLLVMGFMEWVRQRVMVRASGRLDGLLSQRLFRVLFRRGLVSGNSGDTQPLQDFQQVRQFLTGQGLFSILDAPWVPIFLLVIFFFHPLLGVIATIGAVIMIIIGISNHFASKRPLEEANSESVGERRALGGELRNAEVAEALGMIDRLMARWEERHNKVLSLQARASDRAGPFYAASKTLQYFMQVIILAVGAFLAIQQIITPGVMIAANILAMRALAPLNAVIGQARNLTSVRSAFQRLDQALVNHPERNRRMSLPKPKGKLTAESLAIAPPRSRTPIVRNVGFDIEAGETVGIMGPSGGGKSTLIRGLLGVWPILAGHARIDGADVGDWNRDELGPYLGYLPQDVELFDGTIAENISRFADQPNSQDIISAAQEAGVHELILRLPDGYDTYLGPGGTTLSAGQRQRIGLARALYGNPQILILDEPNSNLDEEGEKALARAIAKGKQEGRTQLVASHRQSLRGELDRILVVKDGKLALDGPADKVIERLKGGSSGKDKANVRPIRPASPETE